MKVYVASSFNNFNLVRQIGVLLRERGIDTYVFCDETAPAYKYSREIRASSLKNSWNFISALQVPHTQQIYIHNVNELLTSDLVLLVLPCGKSSHIEAGFIKGQGKYVVVIGDTVAGDWDAMYHMFDRFFSADQWPACLNYIARVKEALDAHRSTARSSTQQEETDHHRNHHGEHESTDTNSNGKPAS